MFSVTAAQEIPRPKNWQDFQRGCVVLFQAELKDPHAQECGRHGQKQRGIDILGRRNGEPGSHLNPENDDGYQSHQQVSDRRHAGGRGERFQQKYVLQFALAEHQGRHFRKLKQELDAAGFKPAPDPAKVGAAFYRRADLGLISGQL